MASFAVAAALAGVAANETPASTSGSSGARLDQEVADIVAHNPGARRLNETSILLKPGVLLSLPGPTRPDSKLVLPTPDGSEVVAATAAATCSYGWLCMWIDAQRQGAQLSLYTCSYLDLRDFYWGWWGQHNFRDKVSSIWNNQSPAGSIFSHFYDYNSVGGLVTVGHLRSGSWLDNLALDRALDGKTWNDRIDTVSVC